MKKHFDPTEPVLYVDADGSTRPARIISTDRKCDYYTLVALVEMSPGFEEIISLSRNGRKLTEASVPRLENIPDKRVGWVNVYPARFGVFCWTRAEADEQAEPNRIACIEIEFEEGEGL